VFDFVCAQKYFEDNIRNKILHNDLTWQLKIKDQTLAFTIEAREQFKE